MYKISINELKLFGFHGEYDIEKKNGQFFTLDINYHMLGFSLDDRISNTIDYLDVVLCIKKNFNIKRFNLLEELCEHIASMLVKKYKMKYINIAISKSNKFINENIDSVKVEFEISNE
tara:strand:+ start:354 stop:707 length:354 start_codon:yes stop_codon:yes gene_type:complete